MKSKQENTLEALLARNPAIRKQLRDRAGLPELASFLLELRRELGMSQKELAKKAGVPKTTISELENIANEGVTLRTLVKLARGAGASLNLGFCVDESAAGSVSVSLNCGYNVEVAPAIERQKRKQTAFAA